MYRCHLRQLSGQSQRPEVIHGGSRSSFCSTRLRPTPGRHSSLSARQAIMPRTKRQQHIFANQTRCGTIAALRCIPTRIMQLKRHLPCCKTWSGVTAMVRHDMHQASCKLANGLSRRVHLSSTTLATLVFILHNLALLFLCHL